MFALQLFDAQLIAALTRQLNEARRREQRRVDEGICRHDLAHYGRAKTSARLVGTPIRYASRRAGFEPYVARRLE
jgi:hypothetical protein